MIYNCKLIVKEDKANDNCFFDIYIKYKPQSSIGFYKKYFILNELKSNNSEDVITIIKKLRWFNNLSMEDIKQMVIKEIKNKTKRISEDNQDEIYLQEQIKLAKEKVKKFTVEI